MIERKGAIAKCRVRTVITVCEWWGGYVNDICAIKSVDEKRWFNNAVSRPGLGAWDGRRHIDHMGVTGREVSVALCQYRC